MATGPFPGLSLTAALVGAVTAILVANPGRAAADYNFYENPNCFPEDGAYQLVAAATEQASSSEPPKNVTAQPYCRTAVKNDRKVPVFWPLDRRRIEMRLALGSCEKSCAPGVDSSVLLGAIDAAMAEWNNAGEGCSDISLRRGAPSTTIYSNNDLFKDPKGVSGGDGINNVRWREDQWDDHAQLAVTTLLYNPVTGEIMDADIDVNGVDNLWSNKEPDMNTGRTFDIQSVLTHELGHVIGFAHSKMNASTMDPYNQGFGATRLDRNGEPMSISQRTLEPEDIQGLCETYASGKPAPGAQEVVHGGLQANMPGAGCQAAGGSAQTNAWSFLMLVGVAMSLRRLRAARPA